MVRSRDDVVRIIKRVVLYSSETTTIALLHNDCLLNLFRCLRRKKLVLRDADYPTDKRFCRGAEDGAPSTYFWRPYAASAYLARVLCSSGSVVFIHSSVGRVPT